jgi:hypothetical protein
VVIEEYRLSSGLIGVLLLPPHCTIIVDLVVIHRAERYEVLLRIIARVAAKLFVMDFWVDIVPHNWYRRSNRGCQALRSRIRGIPAAALREESRHREQQRLSLRYLERHRAQCYGPVTKSDDARRRAIASQVPQFQFGSRRAIPTIGPDRKSSSARTEL